jgi:hypothetical protein
MNPTQLVSPEKPYDDQLKCESCGCTGEARRMKSVSELPVREWMQPPNGWWVHLDASTLRVRCPNCLEGTKHDSKPPTVSSIRPSIRRETQ